MAFVDSVLNRLPRPNHKPVQKRKKKETERERERNAEEKIKSTVFFFLLPLIKTAYH